jgi:hypothetical protein
MDAQADLSKLEVEFAALQARKTLTKGQKNRAFILGGLISQARLAASLAGYRA